MNDTNLNKLCGIIRADALTPHEMRKLIAHFGSAEALAAASSEELRATGLGAKTSAYLADQLRQNSTDNEVDQLAAEGIVTVFEDDPRYPPLLAEIPDPPPVLFLRGNPDAITAPHALTVIGSRLLTNYGRQAARLLLAPCVRAGATIISGLAFGADAAAHEAALAGGGVTVAVLASGVDRECVGPRANYPLAERILAAGGCLVSEYPPGMFADKARFPQRNRLLAGLSLVTLALEAAERSGSLITCRYALEFGRELMAVPGPITSIQSAATNRLIATGAKPALTAEDIIMELKLVQPVLNRHMPADPLAAAVLVALRDSPASADALADYLDLPIRQILTTLMALESDGFITQQGEAWGAV
jgi:DNA processing protein